MAKVPPEPGRGYGTRQTSFCATGSQAVSQPFSRWSATLRSSRALSCHWAKVAGLIALRVSGEPALSG